MNKNNKNTETNLNKPNKEANIKQKYSSVINNRLEVAQTIDTTFTEEEQQMWDEMKYNHALEEKAKKKQIVGWIVFFVISIISLILLLIWWFHHFYGYLFQ